MQTAPLFEDVAGGPPGGEAWWVDTSDGVRIRIGVWHPEGATRGTMLMFPGRTEYIEKYGDAAREMADRGYATLAIDWRGQGLAQRLLEDRRIGHVSQFPDYQKDIAAALRAARELNLPRPFHLLAHSMGGCIGLRAVMEGLPVQSCAFTGPMWGIAMSPVMKPFGWATAFVGSALGFGNRIAPLNTLDNYVETHGFKDNWLTNDPDMFAMMQDQLSAHPDLSLGGPSLGWLRGALSDCHTLAGRPSPDLPCLTFLGTREQIVHTPAIHDRMARWPRGQLDLIDGGEHEVLMDTPAVRTRIFDRLDTLFSTRPPDRSAGSP